MSIQGELTTMTLEELLQWAAAARRTGTLEIKRGNISKRIMFRDGQVIACSSDDPTSLLGQFLLARGRITKETLRDGLARQEATGENLGRILVDMGALTEEEVTRFVEAKIEDTVYGMFDWQHGQFRFMDRVEPGRRMIDVEMSVEHILLKGAKRYDEASRIREVFHDPGIVLERTDAELPDKIAEKPMILRLLELVDGERTLAELLLHAHASEFLVTKFLYQLHKGGLVRVRELRLGTTGADPGPDFEMETGERGPIPEDVVTETPSTMTDITLETEVAKRLMSRGEHEAALEVLAASNRAHPDHETLAELIAEAEAACLADAQDLKPEKVPTRMPAPVMNTPLAPTESFLLTLIDDKADVKSILWIAPMSAVDVLRTLKRLSEKKIIELRDARPDISIAPEQGSSVA
jgi:hypothetical protein